jgi:hypothetical protein
MCLRRCITWLGGLLVASYADLWSLPTTGGTPVGVVTMRAGVGAFAIDAVDVAWVDTLDAFRGISGLVVSTH